MSELLYVNRLHKSYNLSGKKVTAVQDVTFEIRNGECLGLVGESGSGKSTLTRLLLALERPDNGEIEFNGSSILGMSSRHLREMRRHMQVVFQDPTSSLNPKIPIWRSVLEPLDHFPEVLPSMLSDVRQSRRQTAARLFHMAGLDPEYMDHYPHELSGGQRQRVAIARGISLGPKLLICDEPTSSLDVSVQGQILQLLKSLQKKLGMAYLFISHDIAAVRMMSDRMIVMKEGTIVDHFLSDQFWSENRHEYTRLLVASVS